MAHFMDVISFLKPHMDDKDKSFLESTRYGAFTYITHTLTFIYFVLFTKSANKKGHIQVPLSKSLTLLGLSTWMPLLLATTLIICRKTKTP